jgi:hypothetical protein
MVEVGSRYPGSDGASHLPIYAICGRKFRIQIKAHSPSELTVRIPEQIIAGGPNGALRLAK